MAPTSEEPPTLTAKSDGHYNGNRTTSLASIEPPTYPTRSLHFLQPSKKHHASETTAPKLAKVKLNVIVVGAGLGGLAGAIALVRRGHKVDVFEQASELGEVSTVQILVFRVCN